MSATTAQAPVVYGQPTDPFEDFTGITADEYGEVVPIPMPPLTHPAGDQAHPWSD